MTKPEASPDPTLSAVAKLLGVRGGTTRRQRMTAEERSASGPVRRSASMGD